MQPAQNTAVPDNESLSIASPRTLTTSHSDHLAKSSTSAEVGYRSETATTNDWQHVIHDQPLQTPALNALDGPQGSHRGMAPEATNTVHCLDDEWTRGQQDGCMPDFTMPSPQQYNDNFASWLFNSPGSQFQNFDLSNLPYVDFGLDYCSPLNEIWNLEPFTSVQITALFCDTPEPTDDDRCGEYRKFELKSNVAGELWKQSRWRVGFPGVVGTRLL